MTYIPNIDITPEQLKDNNFYYKDGFYTYRFPVYNDQKNKRNTLFWAILSIELENRLCSISVVDTTNNVYPAFYNREYGENLVVQSIDRKIKSKMNELVKLNIIKKK